MEPTQSSTSSKLHKSSIPLENSPWNSHLYPPQPWLNAYNNPSMLFSASNGSHGFNLNHEEDEELDDQTSIDVTQNPNRDYEMMEKEPMFEKPLTPSDVGKLNRLVIPKQHAEKYFPLSGDSGDKGLLLSFEDESGKCWRFRYSYWNSSQSYVLTKGWSRYVKEKQLDAGDIILFQRHRTDGDRLFIGWRRRGAAVTLMEGGGTLNNNGAVMGNSGGGGGCNEGWSRGLYQVQGNPYLGHIQGHGANVPYQPDCLHAGSIAQNQAGGANPRRLVRLFGVNLECHLDESEPSTPDSSSVSSQGPSLHPFYSQSYTSNYMDITFSRDINQMRNNQG